MQDLYASLIEIVIVILIVNFYFLSLTIAAVEHIHEGADELSSYLKEEIQNEKQNERKVSDELRGFVFTASEADVKLQKKDGNETITITANVNDSVDAEDSVQDPNVEPTETKMLSKPDFTVEITKGHRIISFHCTFNQTLPEDQPGDEPYSDVFQIAEISVYDGEFKDSTYTVSGDIMDGYLYDLLLNYLEEKGITNEFADEMVELFTAYEHKLYINLLEKLNKYFGK
ncbi:complement component 1 Q subcomponent-binding protein, mitochondrial [Caerostris extrusa]|uniref:Complement component 1 Q subcomponent-binding protein, mitochondrial n=1 Tax=Caerostris extrusa TaxID=172846 RepID=A0AAV4VWS8_CAEEX|nr:complement component 1 Q subcomponent-binding protein, mitochondrial [Caerostris extrusa]